jgi:Alkylmercury lyase
MLLFRVEEHIERWREQWHQPRGAVLSIETTWRLGAAWYGRKMDPDWRRFTLEEAEAVLGSFGLVGDFWSLR